MIECGRSFDGGEEDIRPAVAVDVTKCRPCADEEVAVGERVCVVHVIAVREASGGRRELREARVAASGDDKVAPAVAGFLVPRRVHRGGRCARDGKDDKGGGAGA